MRFVKSLIVAAAVLSISAAEHDPAEELASFQIADGFEVNLFASEKDRLIKPIQIRFDARGRLWVIGSAVYPQLEPGQKPNDKVLILEDANGDGRVDSVKTFADGLMIPTGLELTRDGAYVGHGTELLLLRDTDGDERADERTVVLRGFGTGDNHQNINSFTWSPSGELWMCQGLHILSRVETIHGLVELNKAGIWRYRPRLQKLEGFYGSEHEPQNPWGHVFNEWNEHIVLAGNNSSPIFADPGLVPNRRDDPPPLIWPDGKGRKVSGGDFVANAHWPDDWQGRLILGGYINNAVWSANVVDDGSGFRFEDGPPLIRSTRREFRPVDVKFGPDGALYLCDWYNPIIGHYQASFRHPDRDKTHGRIWRVTAKGRALTPRPKIADASVEELVAHLGTKDRWTRQNTIRELSQRAAKDVVPPLVSWASNPSRTERELMHAVGILQTHEKPSAELLVRLAKASESRARAYAAYLLGSSASSVETLKTLGADPHPRVRLEALIAAAQVNTREAVDVLVAAADKPFDRFLTYAFNQAVHSLKPHWRPLSIPLDRPEVVAAFVRADGTADTLDALRKVQDSQRGLLTILAEVGTADDLASILKRSESQLGSMPLRAMAHRTIKPAGDIVALLKPYFDSRLIHDAVVLAGHWKVESLLPKIRELAKERENPVAIQTLAKFGTNELPLIRQIATNGSAKAKSVALPQWQIFEPREAARSAAEFLATEAGSENCENLVQGFLTRPAGIVELAKAIVGKNIPPNVARAALTVINASGKHEELARAFSKTNPDRKVVNEDFVAAVRERGDAKRGAEIYNRMELGCALCHKVNGKGGTVGPELSALGTAQPIDFIARAILEPQKEIKEGFSSVLIALKNGEEIQGYVVRETKDEIVVRQPLLNAEVRLQRAQIASSRNNGSLMPAGLVDQLSKDEFRDLVKYLSTLGKP
jgi:putative heme-binding domain-containing protein